MVRHRRPRFPPFVAWWRIDGEGGVHASNGQRLLVEQGHRDAELRVTSDEPFVPPQRA
jgi:hypothetical protein